MSRLGVYVQKSNFLASREGWFQSSQVTVLKEMFSGISYQKGSSACFNFRLVRQEELTPPPPPLKFATDILNWDTNLKTETESKLNIICEYNRNCLSQFRGIRPQMCVEGLL